VVRNSGFADHNRLGQRTNIQFPNGQSVQNADPAGIAEGAEEFRHVGGSMFVKLERDILF
jgi:hypothetical protein